MRRHWWIIAAVGLAAPTVLSACTQPAPCYELVGAFGTRFAVLNACSGNIELRDPPEMPPLPPETTTTAPQQEVWVR